MISVDDVIDRSLAMKLVVLTNYSTIQSIQSAESFLFLNSSLRISNLLGSQISFLSSRHLNLFFLINFFVNKNYYSVVVFLQ